MWKGWRWLGWMSFHLSSRIVRVKRRHFPPSSWELWVCGCSAHGVHIFEDLLHRMSFYLTTVTRFRDQSNAEVRLSVKQDRQTDSLYHVHVHRKPIKEFGTVESPLLVLAGHHPRDTFLPNGCFTAVFCRVHWAGRLPWWATPLWSSGAESISLSLPV